MTFFTSFLYFCSFLLNNTSAPRKCIKKNRGKKMPQLCACDNLCVCCTTNTNHLPTLKIVATSDTNNAGLLTYVFNRKYVSLPNSSVTDFRHDIFSQTHTAAVPLGIPTRFSFHRIYPYGIYDTLRVSIQFFKILPCLVISVKGIFSLQCYC